MTVRMWRGWWYQFWYQFFLEFFAIWKMLFLLSLLHQIPLEFLLTLQPYRAKNYSDHFSDCDQASERVTGLNCLPPGVGNYSELCSDCIPAVETFSGQDCLHPVHVNYSENYSESDPVQPRTEPTCLPLVHVYFRDTLLSLNQNAQPLNSTLAATLSDLGITRRSRPRRSRPGGRRRQRIIPVLSLSSSTEIRTPDSLLPDCCPIADVCDNTLLDLHQSGDVYSTTSLNVTDCGVASPHSPSPVPFPVPFPNPNNRVHIPTTPCPRSKTLKIASFNAQALGTRKEKRTAINYFIHENDIDIFVVCETWFLPVGDEAKCRQLSPPGYRTLSFPRSTRGGGIAVVVADSLLPFLSTKTDFTFQHPSFELVQFIFTLPHHTFHLFCLYRPSPSKKNQLKDSMFIEEFPELLAQCNSLNAPYMIVGDFNFHYDVPTNTYTAKIMDILESFSLVQSVRVPTQNRGHTLDWVVHRADRALLKSLTVDHTLPSDHVCIQCQLYLTRPPPSHVYVQARKLADIDLASFNSDLQARLAACPPTSADDLNKLLADLLDQHAPATRRRVPQRRPTPWFTDIGPQLQEAKRERRRAERQWLKSGLYIHKQIFQATNKAMNVLVHAAKSAYYNAKILACSSSKQLYGITSKLLGKSDPSPLPSSIPAARLPQVFSDYFTEKISSLRQLLDTQSCPQSTFPDPPFSGTPLTSFRPITKSDLKKIIQKISVKTCELDPLPVSLLTHCLDTLLPHLTSVINNSLLSGAFPPVFKSAIVRPLLKKPTLDPENLKNYRPVSNLSFLSKLTERVILAQLLEHLESNNLVYIHQSAYRSGHSTETALLKIVNDLLTALDSSQVSLLSLLDLSSAFDTIDHQILLNRLQSSFGITCSALSWFQSYLSERPNVVSVNGLTSSPSIMQFGVPQGSVLGPILFILYTHPIPSIVNHHSLSHHSFSDDNQLYISGPISSLPTLISSAQSCISDLKSWMTQNKLKLNEDKTEMIILSPPRLFTTHPLPSSVSLNGVDIPLSSAVRNLGVTLDQSLSFHQHATNVCKACYYEIRRISSIRHLLTVDATKTLLCAFVLSRLDYCNSLLSGSPKTLTNRLQKVQNHAARLVYRSSRHDHITPLLRSLHWLPIEQRISHKISSLCFKSLDSSGPHYLSDLLTLYTPSRQLRSSCDTRLFRIPTVRTKSFGQRSFSFQGPSVWNQLPHSVRFSPSLQSFKTKLKTHLFSQ